MIYSFHPNKYFFTPQISVIIYLKGGDGMDIHTIPYIGLSGHELQSLLSDNPTKAEIITVLMQNNTKIANQITALLRQNLENL